MHKQLESSNAAKINFSFVKRKVFIILKQQKYLMFEAYFRLFNTLEIC